VVQRRHRIPLRGNLPLYRIRRPKTGEVQEQHYAISTASDDVGFVATAANDQKAAPRRFQVAGEVGPTELTLVEGSTTYTLRATYAGDDGGDGDGEPPSSTSGVDLGMDLLIVGRRIDPSTQQGLKDK
jgi:hypothetical protein